MFGKFGKALATWRRRDERLADVERDLAKGWSLEAYERLRALAADGGAAAQYRLGQMYENAEGVVQSLADAAHWYRLAGAQGYPPAQARLGLIYFIDPPTPAGLTGADEPGAESPALPGTLAQFFPHGVSVRQDFAEAFKWNREAAEYGGAADAQARLGQQYALGLGTARDVAEAERWFTAAAAQGDAGGQLGLGLLYAGGYETPADLPRAVEWLRLAAANGHATAEYALGKLLLHGAGTAKDPDAARAHLERSAAQD